MEKERLINFQREVDMEVTSNILPFWAYKTIDEKGGGFHGSLTNELVVNEHAPRGAVLYTRLLWAFSRASALDSDEIYLDRAHRVYRYISEHFIDGKHGGIYWSVGSGGQPLDRRKQIYAQAFAIYALAEYYRVSKEKDVLELAISIFRLCEKHAFDSINEGYFDAFERNWKRSRHMFLNSSKRPEAKKSMNTQLHVLEAYTNLFRSWGDNHLQAQIRRLLMVFKNRIFDPVKYHFRLFFTHDWQVVDNRFSYGHEIEGSWLLSEAAALVNDEELNKEITRLALQLAACTAREGISPVGGIWNEGSEQGLLHDDYDWWPQAEAMVGFLNAYEKSRDEKYIALAIRSWDFIKKYFVDPVNGEWFWRINNDLTVNNTLEKAGFWKCPYHNTRACLEASARIRRLLTK